MTDKFYRLADFDTFDLTAFDADQSVTQEECNLVLALALVVNDLKDAIYANQLLKDEKPNGEFKKTRHWGSYAGIYNHIMRYFIGILNEILVLIQDNRKTIDQPFFQSVVKCLRPKEKAAWQTFVLVADGRGDDTTIGKFIIRVRNKVSFHYDAGEIHAGYRSHFLDLRKGTERAYVSRGKNLAETRFFFADAAASGYVTKPFNGKSGEDLMTECIAVVCSIALPFRAIVYQFIQERGFTFKRTEEDA